MQIYDEMSDGELFSASGGVRCLMPIYEYLCKACQHRFECLLLASSGAAKCPICESGDLEQLVSASAVRSESTTQASLTAEHRKVAAARGDRLREQHQHLHEHFEDSPSRSSPGQAVKKIDD